MGEYLLVCLAFVICALMEFAITILVNYRQGSKWEYDIPTKSWKKNNGASHSVVSQITGNDLMTPESRPTESIVNPVANCPVNSRLVAAIKKSIQTIPATYLIDFVAFWIHFFLFFVFNCYYWNKYWMN